MKLKDYAIDSGLFFCTTEPPKTYATHTGATSDSIGALDWDTGERVWLDAELEITPIAVPQPPIPPSKSWLDCSDTTKEELVHRFKQYARQVEAYIEAMQKAESNA